MCLRQISDSGQKKKNAKMVFDFALEGIASSRDKKRDIH